MHPSTSKYKIYLYLFFFISISSIYNFQFLNYFQHKFLLKKIHIEGLNELEKKIIENELDKFKNTNIFKLTQNEIFNQLNQFNFIENINASIILPSTINVNLSKTLILGKTTKNGKTFYIGGNGKLIRFINLYENDQPAEVFGDFKIKDFLNLLNVLDAQKLSQNKIDKYYYYKNKRWDLLFTNGLTLKLPNKNIENSIKIFKTLLNNKSLTNAKIVDLRIRNQIIISNANE